METNTFNTLNESEKQYLERYLRKINKSTNINDMFKYFEKSSDEQAFAKIRTLTWNLENRLNYDSKIIDYSCKLPMLVSPNYSITVHNDFISYVAMVNPLMDYPRIDFIKYGIERIQKILEDPSILENKIFMQHFNMMYDAVKYWKYLSRGVHQKHPDKFNWVIDNFWLFGIPIHAKNSKHFNQFLIKSWFYIQDITL